MIVAILLAWTDPTAMQAVRPLAAGMADDRCVIVGEFVGKAGTAGAVFSRMPFGGDELRMALPRSIDRDAKELKVSATLDPGGVTYDLAPLFRPGESADGRSIRTMAIPRELTDGLGSAASLSLSIGQITTKLPVLGGPTALGVIDQCEHALALKWGGNLAEAALVIKSAQALNRNEWLTDSDYPSYANKIKGEGAVTALLHVEPDGHVSACRVVASSQLADLNDVTCRLLKARARFKPAEDAKGKTIRQTTTQRVRWQMFR